MRNPIPLIARILISAIFLMSALNKIMDPAGTQQYMSAYGMPLTGWLIICAIILELGGGLSLLLGYKARWGAIALIVFLIPSTLIFHNQLSDQTQMIMFMKNLTTLGGLLMVAYFGSGPLCLDGIKLPSNSK